MQKAWVDIKQQFVLLGLGLLQSAMPALEKVFGVIQHVGNWLVDHKQFVLDFFKVFAVGIGIVGTALGVAQLEDAPSLAAVLAVGALAAAIGLLWDDYQTWKVGGKSLINWGQWKTEIDAAAAGMDFLKKVALTAFEAIATAAKVAQQVMHGDFAGANKTLVSGTEKMNKKLLGHDLGPDEAHDQNAARATALVKKIPGALKSIWGQSDVGTPYKPGAVSSAIGQVEGFNAKGAKPNRPQRNHNPGDIEYGKFARDHGATGSDGRFAIFPDDETGYKALDALLASKAYAGLTIPQAIAKFAPSFENDTTGYTANVLKRTGATATTTVAQAQAAPPSPSSALRGIPGATSMVAQAGSTRAGVSSTTTTITEQP